MSYNNDTELRFVHPNDIYKLAVILDENDGWKKLMEVIPKKLNKKSNGTSNKSLDTFDKFNTHTIEYTRKYNNDHVRLVEIAGRRSNESRLFTQILMDEWSTSGNKKQRPTLELLLELLIRSQQYRAVDFVADYLLKETLPQRPTYGPAAKVNTAFHGEMLSDIKENSRSITPKP